MSTYFERQGHWDAFQGKDTEKDAPTLRRPEAHRAGSVPHLVAQSRVQSSHSNITSLHKTITLQVTHSLGP